MSKEEIFGMVMEKPWSEKEVHELVDSKMQHIMERTGSDKYELYLTGSGNFRIAIATVAPYKGQRKGDKPYHWDTVSKRLKEHWGAIEYCGIEADDIMAIRATELAKEYPSEDIFVVASRDKDLRQVPGLHFSWACGEQQPEKPVYKVDDLGFVDYEVYVSPKGDKSYKLVGTGMRFFYGQILTGDSVDNIKGCPRVGPKLAATALMFCQSEKELFEACAPFYIKVYGDDWKRYLLENARLVYLLRDRSWFTEEEESPGVIRCFLQKLWELPYDYSSYDSRTEVSNPDECGASP
jgi:hypothetical protein